MQVMLRLPRGEETLSAEKAKPAGKRLVCGHAWLGQRGAGRISCPPAWTAREIPRGVASSRTGAHVAVNVGCRSAVSQSCSPVSVAVTSQRPSWAKPRAISAGRQPTEPSIAASTSHMTRRSGRRCDPSGENLSASTRARGRWELPLASCAPHSEAHRLAARAVAACSPSGDYARAKRPGCPNRGAWPAVYVSNRSIPRTSGKRHGPQHGPIQAGHRANRSYRVARRSGGLPWRRFVAPFVRDKPGQRRQGGRA